MTGTYVTTGSHSSGARAGIDSGSGGGPRAASWRTARGALALDRPRIMAILNVTPDSFVPASRRQGQEAALELAAGLVAAGADILDIGGESTRPGAARIEAAEERDRVLPVVEAVRREWPAVLVSVDTVKAQVAREALAAGADIINDVSGLRLDPRLGAVCAEAGAGVVLMHSRGGVERMASYETARYDLEVGEAVVVELTAALERARSAGIADAAVVLDPGLGFSKRTDDSVAALRSIPRILGLGRPVLVGPSRKRFVGELAGGLPVEDRLPGTIAACVAALMLGARIFRVHDVRAVRDALAVAEAVAP